MLFIPWFLSAAFLDRIYRMDRDHKDEIDQQMKDADDFVAELRDSNDTSPLARKLAATDSGSDTISP